MDTIDQQFANYSGVFEILELIALVFLAIILAEAVWDIFIQKRRKIAESAANIAIAISNSLLERTVYGLVFIIGLVIAQPLSPLAIPETWWSWILALLLADFTYYWMHRCEHEVRILWAYHSVHHSSPEFNLTTGLRLAWVEGLIEWLFFCANDPDGLQRRANHYCARCGCHLSNLDTHREDRQTWMDG